MAITMQHLIREARAQGGPSRLTVNGREFKVEIIHGKPFVTVDGQGMSQLLANELLDNARLVESLDAERINPVNPIKQEVMSIKQMLIIADRMTCKQVQDVGGHRYAVSRHAGVPVYHVNEQSVSQQHAEQHLLYSVSAIPGAFIANDETVSPSLYIQTVGRVTRQPKNEAEVHEHVSRLITELAPMLENLADHYEIAQAPTAATKIRQLLHLNQHGTFPLATK